MAHVRSCKFVIAVLMNAALALAMRAADTANGKPPILTVCEALREARRYTGQVVIVVGRSASTSEGSWLDENCDLKLVVEGRPYPNTISTAYVASEFAPPPRKPNGFKWDKRGLKRALDQVQSTTRLEYKSRWYAVYGRLEAEPARNIPIGGGLVATTSGYGHLGGAPAQLIFPEDAFLRLKAK